MAFPIILFENILEPGTAGTFTSSGAAAGFPGTNVLDWRPGTPYRWKIPSGTGSGQWVKIDLGSGNTAKPTTVAVGGHNLHGGTTCHLDVEWSDDNSAWTTALTGPTPTTGLPFLRTFTVSVAHRYWRCIVRTAGGVSFSADTAMGIITLGRRLDFEKGLSQNFDPYQIETVVEDSKNENGSPLGTSPRYRRKVFPVMLNDAGMTKAGFYRPASGLSWDVDFARHALMLPPNGKANPFWFAWNITEDVEEVWLCTVRKASNPPLGSLTRRALSAEFEGWRELA